MTEEEKTRSDCEFWALIWREGEDWGWLCSLDGNRECTTQEPARRLRYESRERALSALWKFRADNAKRKNERVSLVRVRAKQAASRTP